MVTLQGYLIVGCPESKSGELYDNRITARFVKKKGKLDLSEIPIFLSIDIPNNYFRKPIITASINLPPTKNLREAQVEISERAKEIIKESLSHQLKVKVEFLDESGDRVPVHDRADNPPIHDTPPGDNDGLEINGGRADGRHTDNAGIQEEKQG